MSAQPAAPPPAPAKASGRRTQLATILFLVAGVLAFVLPPVFLLSGEESPRPIRILDAFRNGGRGMLGILLCQTLAWPIVLILGVRRIRGRRAPGAALFLSALAPFTVGALAMPLAAARVVDSAVAETRGPVELAWYMASHLGSLSLLQLYGGTAAALAMLLVAVAAVLGLPAAGAGRARLAPIAVALGFALAGVAARAALLPGFFAPDGLALAGLALAGLLAAAGCRRYASDDAVRALHGLLLAAAATAVAVWLADRAGLSASTRGRLHAIGGYSLLAVQRVDVLRRDFLPAFTIRPWITALDTAGVLAAFAVPLAKAWRMRAKLARPVVAGAAIVVTALATALGLRPIEQAAEPLLEPFSEVERALAVQKVSVPTDVGDIWEGTEPLPGRAELLVKADGALAVPAPRSTVKRPEGDRLDIAADASLRFDAFMAAVTPVALRDGVPSVRAGLVLQPRQRVDLTALGPLAGLFGTDLFTIPVTLHPRFSAGLPEGRPKQARAGLAVLPDGDTARVVAVRSATDMVRLPLVMPLAYGKAAMEARQNVIYQARVAHFEVNLIWLAPAPGATMAEVAAQLQALAASRSGPPELLVLTADRATLEAASGP